MSRKPLVVNVAKIVIFGFLLSGCAMEHGVRPMGGMQARDGLTKDHEPHMMKMFQALGCPHAPMDMGAMKAMTPEQHKSMMAKHAADCREKLLSEGRIQANVQAKDCMSRALAGNRRGARKITAARVDAAVAQCTQPAAASPAPGAQSPTHAH